MDSHELQKLKDKNKKRQELINELRKLQKKTYNKYIFIMGLIDGYEETMKSTEEKITKKKQLAKIRLVNCAKIINKL